MKRMVRELIQISSEMQLLYRWRKEGVVYPVAGREERKGACTESRDSWTIRWPLSNFLYKLVSR